MIFLAALAVAAAPWRGDHRPAQLERRQGARLTTRRRAGRRGLVATVIVLPALLLSFWLVMQYAIAAHVRHVALAAAQDAALAAASGSGDRSAAARERDGRRRVDDVGRRRVGAGDGPRAGDGDGACRGAAGVPDRRLRRRRVGVGAGRALRPPAGAAVSDAGCAVARGDAGPLELVILVPVVLLVFGLVVAFSRTTTADAARRSTPPPSGPAPRQRRRRPVAATALATDVVADSLAGSACRAARRPVVGTLTPGGQRHRHRVVHGRSRRRHQFGSIPGSRTLTASATEVIDRTRGGGP